jgi:hypothetical protein
MFKHNFELPAYRSPYLTISRVHNHSDTRYRLHEPLLWPLSDILGANIDE